MGFVDRPQALRWRKALFQVHMWAGIVIALYLVAISASGSILVFQRNIEDNAPRLDPKVTAPFTYQQIVDVAQRAFPGEPLSIIDMRSSERRVVTVGLRDGKYERVVYVDTVSGRIVGQYVLQKRHAFMASLEDLHKNLLGGLRGGEVDGIGGALLFLMAISGLILWWPGLKSWTRGLKVKWNARWTRVNWDLHRAFGFWALLLIGMWGITGTYFIFSGPVQKAISVVFPMPHFRQKASDWKPGQPLHSVDTYILKAKRAYPHSERAYVFMDVYRSGGVVKIFLSRDPQRPMVLLEDVIAFQPTTLKVLSNISTSNLNLVERLSLAVYSIHAGDFGGTVSKIFWFALGLIPAFLAVTGVLMWWNRSLKRKWLAIIGDGMRRKDGIGHSGLTYQPCPPNSTIEDASDASNYD